MVDQEMLSAISDLLEEKLEEKLEKKLEKKLDQKFDEKLQPVYDRLDGLETDMHYVRVEQLENNVMPRLNKLETDMRYVRVVQLENSVIPRLNTIEACYLDTSKRYLEKTEQMEDMAADIVILKNVVSGHSETLQQMQG